MKSLNVYMLPRHNIPVGKRQPSAGRRDDHTAFRGFGRGCECAVPCGGAERRESYRHHGRRQQGHPQRRSADHKVGFMLKPITPDGVKKQLKKLRYPIGGLE